MVLSRVVFEAKFGKANDVVAMLKESLTMMTDEQAASLQPRILTDISGRFDTVVIEMTHENLAALEQFREALFAMGEAAAESSGMFDLVETGRNEYWTIES